MKNLQELRIMAGVHAQLSYYMKTAHDYQELQDDIWSYLESVKGEINAYKTAHPEWHNELLELKKQEAV
jgi:hypothetical protein